MERLEIDGFGKGLFTNLNPTLIPPGNARISQNFLHNLTDRRVKLRKGINRVWHTRAANLPIYGLFQFINNAGTITNLVQTNGTLYTFSMTPGTLTSLGTGRQSSNIASFTQYLNFWIEADYQTTNYIGNGTVSYPFQVAAPTDSFTATPSAGAGLTAGTYQYDYARYSTTTTELSPPRGTAVSASPSAGNLRVTLTNATVATSNQFDQIQIYRTKVGGSQYYELAKITVASFNSGYIDSIPDASLLTVSTNHALDSNLNGTTASNTSKPEAGLDCVQHKGRLHFIGLNGFPSRHRWSQLLNYSFDSTTDARHDVEPDDGDILVRGFSTEGALVLFKRNSIHLMNGDVDQDGFTWQVASPKVAGIGAYCPNTAVDTGSGIIFMANSAVYRYRVGGVPEKISSPIQDQLDAADLTRRDYFVGVYDNSLNAYLLSVTPTGQTTNTITYIYFLETGYWGSFQYGAGKINPSMWGTFVNSSNQVKPYLGDTQGYGYETNTSNTNDGVTSGTVTGTPTTPTVPAYQGKGAVVGFGHPISVAVPAGVVAGDLLVAIVSIVIPSDTLVPPAGWTILDSVRDVAGSYVSTISYKIASGSEPATYSFTSSSGISNLKGVMCNFRYTDTTTPISVHATATAHSLTPTISGITPTIAYSDIVVVLMSDVTENGISASTDPTAGSYTQQINNLSVNSTMSLYDATKTNTTATGTINVSISQASGARNWTLFAFALSPITTTALYDSTAAFRTTGDGLTGLPITTQSGTTYETEQITSNTATILTTTTWTTTPTTSMTYYVGAIEGILELGRLDCGTQNQVRYKRITFEFEKQSSSVVPVLLGYTLDGDVAPTTVQSTLQTSTYKQSILINRTGYGLSPYIRIIGVADPFELIRLDIEYDIMLNRHF